MTDLEPIIRQVRAWQDRMADADGPPGILRSRAYVKRRWPELGFDDREEVLSATAAPRHVAENVLAFKGQR